MIIIIIKSFFLLSYFVKISVLSLKMSGCNDVCLSSVQSYAKSVDIL